MKRTAGQEHDDNNDNGSVSTAAAATVSISMEPTKMTMRELVKSKNDGEGLKTINPTGGFLDGDSYSYIEEDTEAGHTDDSAGAVRFVNGKLILNKNYHVPTSSVVDTYAPPPSKRKATSVYSRRGEGRKTTQKWTREETEKFFNALRTFGTDFTLMEGMFKNRDRRQIKAKFKKEERDHPELIDMVLKSTVPLNEKKLRAAGITFDENENEGDDPLASPPATITSSSSSSSTQQPAAAATAVITESVADGHEKQSNTSRKTAEEEDDEALLRDLFGEEEEDNNNEGSDNE